MDIASQKVRDLSSLDLGSGRESGPLVKREAGAKRELGNLAFAAYTTQDKAILSFWIS